LHEAVHSDWFALEEHCPEQLASHEPSQLALQSRLGGFAVHLALQSALQLVWQSSDACPVHWALHDVSSFAEHAASKWMGSHCVVQPPCVYTLQVASALTLMLPQAARLARASAVVRRTPAEVTTPKSSQVSRRMWFSSFSALDGRFSLFDATAEPE
jgi:hypothetical protein